jgi:hypothetical protein
LQLPKAKGLAGCGPSQRIGAMSPMKPEPLTSASRVDLSAKIANMLMYVNQAFAFCDGRYCRNPARARRRATQNSKQVGPRSRERDWRGVRRLAARVDSGGGA